jgi:hypothetical protein
MVSKLRIHILCCAVPCSAARGPLDFLVIRVRTDLEVIQRSTFCAARYCAAEEQDSKIAHSDAKFQHLILHPRPYSKLRILKAKKTSI